MFIHEKSPISFRFARQSVRALIILTDRPIISVALKKNGI
jgi:hypothetical protein